jgi:hypothetical protein
MAAEQTDARCVDHPEATAIGTCRRCGGFLCATCLGGELCAVCTTRLAEVVARPIGGWLIVPLIFMFGHSVVPFYRGAHFYNWVTRAGGMSAMFRRDPEWFYMSLFDMAAAVAIASWVCFTVPGFFRRRRVTIGRMQLLYAAVLLNNVIVDIINRVQSSSQPPLTELFFQLTMSLIWIQYFRSSKRVRETFVR